MNYKIMYSSHAEEDINWWKEHGSEATKKKISNLLAELKLHPKTSTGQPERLKGDLSGLWSRRINKKDRIIYDIKDDVVVVLLLSLKGHYPKKK